MATPGESKTEGGDTTWRNAARTSIADNPTSATRCAYIHHGEAQHTGHKGKNNKCDNLSPPSPRRSLLRHDSYNGAQGIHRLKAQERKRPALYYNATSQHVTLNNTVANATAIVNDTTGNVVPVLVVVAPVLVVVVVLVVVSRKS